MRLRFRRGDHRHERVVSVRPRPRAGPGKGA
jgi:hypothetical protein